MFAQVSVILNRTVVNSDWWRFDNLFDGQSEGESELSLVSLWLYNLVFDIIGQSSHGNIGHLSNYAKKCTRQRKRQLWQKFARDLEKI